ncbi:hypothetical protein I79_026199 [Cricetulus griseus]|uniref:Uncharacterized protein n=1 Tax=Cricetulus griseus TaxID=10029 RepID=G3IQ96_CRIGR|nr:hypothetical protein I79_026199 [Cricetulus griseus]
MVLNLETTVKQFSWSTRRKQAVCPTIRALRDGLYSYAAPHVPAAPTGMSGSSAYFSCSSMISLYIVSVDSEDSSRR